MVLNLIRRLPVSGQALEPGNALVDPPLHHENVGNRVCAPTISRVNLHRRSTALLGKPVDTRLFIGKGPHRQEAPVVVGVLIPVRRCPLGDIAHPRSAPVPEQLELGAPESKEIERMIPQIRFHDRAGLNAPPVHGVGQGIEIGLLAGIIRAKHGRRRLE